MLPVGEEITVLTRRGVEPLFNKEVMVQSSERKFFFNEYIIRAVKKDASFFIPLQPEFRQSFTFWIYGCSFLLPILLALLFNSLLSVRNLFTLFTPFILAAILPLLLNYHFLMGYALLWTNSYIWSILLCIFLPTLLSVAGTTVVYQKTIGISFLVAASLAYFFSYFLFPLSLSVQMVDRWYFLLLGIYR